VIEDLLSSNQSFSSLLYSVLGIIPEADANMGNVTAEAVLTRRRSNETSNALYLENLAETVVASGRIILEIAAAILGIEVPSDLDVSIESGPLQASQRRDSLQMLLALYPMTPPDKQPALFMEILKSTELPNAEALVASMQQTTQEGDPAMQAQMQAQQLAEMQAQLQAMQQQNAELQQIALSSQQALAAKESEVRAKVMMKQMEIESNERMKQMELGMNYQMNAEDNRTKTTTSVIKAQSDLEKSFQQSTNITRNLEIDPTTVDLDRVRS